MVEETASPSLRLYYNPSSPPSRAVLIFLRMAHIPHEVVFIDLLKGQQRTPEYLSINPAGQVPSIDDGGFRLAECQAILMYLHTSRNCEDHWYPRDIQRRAKVDEFLHWYHTNLRMGGALFRKRVIDPLKGLTVTQEDLAETESLLRKSLAHMEVEIAKGGFVVGSELTLADLAAHAYYVQLTGIAYDFSEFPRVREWGERLADIPEVRETSQPFREILAKLQSR